MQTRKNAVLLAFMMILTSLLLLVSLSANITHAAEKGSTLNGQTQQFNKGEGNPNSKDSKSDSEKATPSKGTNSEDNSTTQSNQTATVTINKIASDTQKQLAGARAAQLEGSKDYALNFMNNYGVPTAKHASYRDQTAILEHVDQFGYPVVIKENGLAGGKGVVIAQDHDAAVQTIKEMFASGQARIVLEECLNGPEYSMFVVISNGHYRILPMAQDHKRAYDGDKGPNTGGMGSYSPLPQLSAADRQRMIDEVVKPTVDGLVKGEYHYHGVLYIGLMLTTDGPKVIEYNVRLGDPETQVVLPRLDTDLYQLVDAAINDQPLPAISETAEASFGVVLASKGYPQKPIHGQELGSFPKGSEVEIDYANVTGTLSHLQGAGGRLLMVLAQAGTLQEAHDRVYAYLEKLDQPECFYRHDIGAKAGL